MQNQGVIQYALAVVIPCWNCENYIKALLDSICNQTFSDWNAFFVDDGCLDKTPEIIQEYQKKDSRIHFAKRNSFPKGAQKCRNIGLRLSEGAEYVVFLDSDDLIAPYCFEQRVGFMRANPSVDFASFPTKAFKKDIYDDTYWGFGIQGKQKLILSLLYWRTLQIFVSSNIYKRSSIINAGLSWDEKLGCMQDADFNIQSLTKGLTHSFTEPSRIDYFYRTGHSSVSAHIAEPAMFDSHLYLIGKVAESFRRAFQTKYDFYLKAYIVNFLGLFKKNRKPVRSLLKLGIVKSHPGFFFQLVLYLLLGMRGRTSLFKRYTSYSGESAKEWLALVTDAIRDKTLAETNISLKGFTEWTNVGKTK
jgi:glycosyltransferase involved in cell wall biosynthesis